MLGVTSRIVKIVDISLLTIFALSFGSSVWNTSLSGMLDNFAGYGSALFTLSSLLFAVYSMFPCCGTFPWMRMALFVSAAGCAICWFLNWQAGNAAMVCTGLNLFDSICTGSWMEYIFCALYVTSIVFQVLFALEVDGDGSANGLSSLGGRKRRTSRRLSRTGEVFSDEGVGGDEEEAAMGLSRTRSRAGRKKAEDSGSEWSEGSEAGGYYAPVRAGGSGRRTAVAHQEELGSVSGSEEEEVPRRESLSRSRSQEGYAAGGL